MGGCHFFITLQFNHIYCVCRESKVPFITVLFITFFITFLIHSGSLQKMLTALFNLKYTEKLMENFFECPGKVFLSIEKVLEKISEDQP